MTITITAFERSPDGGKGLARDTRVRAGKRQAPGGRQALERTRITLPRDRSRAQGDDELLQLLELRGHALGAPGSDGGI
jgi:hypothetical protein